MALESPGQFWRVTLGVFFNIILLPLALLPSVSALTSPVLALRGPRFSVC